MVSLKERLYSTILALYHLLQQIWVTPNLLKDFSAMLSCYFDTKLMIFKCIIYRCIQSNEKVSFHILCGDVMASRLWQEKGQTSTFNSIFWSFTYCKRDRIITGFLQLQASQTLGYSVAPHQSTLITSTLNSLLRVAKYSCIICISC